MEVETERSFPPCSSACDCRICPTSAFLAVYTGELKADGDADEAAKSDDDDADDDVVHAAATDLSDAFIRLIATPACVALPIIAISFYSPPPSSFSVSSSFIYIYVCVCV